MLNESHDYHIDYLGSRIVTVGGHYPDRYVSGRCLCRSVFFTLLVYVVCISFKKGFSLRSYFS